MFAKVFKEHIGFDALVAQLVKEGKTQAQAEAIAAAIGRKKYGKKQFQAMAAKSEVSVQKDPEKTQYGSFMEAGMTDPKHVSKFTADGQLVAVCLSMAKQHGMMPSRVGKAEIGVLSLKGDFKGHPFRGNQHVGGAASAGAKLEEGPQASVPALFTMQGGSKGPSQGPQWRQSLGGGVSSLPKSNITSAWRNTDISPSLHKGLLQSVGRMVSKACKKKPKEQKSDWGTDLGVR